MQYSGLFIALIPHRWRRALHVICALSLIMCTGLPSAAWAEQAMLHGYGQPEGLGNLVVSALAQDSEGYIWAGTANGLYRFDGDRFERVGREEHLFDIKALAADPQGGLWIGADNGLYHWQAGRLQRVNRPGSGSMPMFSSGDLAADRSGAWVISESRLYEMRRDGRTGHWQAAEALDPLKPGDKPAVMSTLAVDADGTLWLACDRALCRLEGRRLARIAEGSGALSGQKWVSLLPTRDGSVWLRSGSHLAQLPPGGQTLVDRGLDHRSAGPDGYSVPLAEDTFGRILTAGTQALSRVDPARDSSPGPVFSRQHGMPPGGRFLALMGDREGSMWLSRAGTGLWRWVGYGRWEHWTVNDGLPHDVVWSVLRDNRGTLNASTSGGLTRFNETSRRFEPLPGAAGMHVTAFQAEPDGSLWAATVEGRLLRRGAQPGSGFRTVTSGTAANYRLFNRPDGKFWFAGEAGIGWWPLASPDRGPSGPAIKVGDGTQAMDACQGSDDILWVASATGLLSIPASGEPKRFEDARLRRYIPAVACRSDGTVFVADDEGRVFRVSPGPQPQVTELTPPMLADRVVMALASDSRGWLWVATDGGVAVWNGQHWRLLDQTQGLLWNDTSSSGIFEDRDGTMWISTSQGLSHLLDPTSVFEPALPALDIRSVLHGGKPLPATVPLRLNWSRTEALEVALEAPSYRNRSTQAFEHRLLGFDETWRRTGGSVVRYAGLPAGSYTLQVRLVDEQLATSSLLVELRLEIDPPWWDTWAFHLMAAALAGAVMLAAHRWRLRAARQRENELAELVAERTRELEASREELRERATKDGLTGAWNRNTVLEMLEHDAERSARDQQPLTVVLADIDHFKRINDELGHPAGDEVLRQFVSRLRAVVRPYDAIGRYGGEEFVLLLRGLCVDQPEDRARVAAIHAAIANGPMMLDHGMQRDVTCSFGAACTRSGAEVTPEDLIRQADEALYRAKRAGRNRVEYAGVGK